MRCFQWIEGLQPMTSNTFTIRPAATGDHAQWKPLWQGYLEFYRSSLAPEVTDLLWQRILDPQHEIRGLLAEADGGLTGLVHFFPHAHTWNSAPVCYLNDLFVLPSVRGGGVGRALIEAVVDEARRQEWTRVYWHTQHDNAVARSLYDKVTGGTDGFVNYTLILAKDSPQ
jgi:GNAT superfamily N-acetyltransferase